MDQVADELLSNRTLMAIYLSNMGTGFFPPIEPSDGRFHGDEMFNI